MTRLQKKLRLTDDALERIARAVQDAERRTSGEIVVAAAKESARYSFWELLAAVVVSLLVFAAALPFAKAITAWLFRMLWDVPAWLVPAFYGITAFALIAILFYVANIPAIDRLIIPRFVQNATVTNRMFRLFAESGVHNTREHCGVLIFISLMERQVRILADSGISAKISPDMWRLIADDLTAGIKARTTEEAIVGAIQHCGDLLTQYFPAQADKDDELPNGMLLLDNAEWN